MTNPSTSSAADDASAGASGSSAVDHPLNVTSETDTPLIPAATVVLLRDGDHGLETLLVRRNSKLEFAGGMWVFPGGRIDPDDYPDGHPASDDAAVMAAARRAAVREASEEAGLIVDETGLVWFSHWTPPNFRPKRFATWFFAARAPEGEVTIDGGEIHGHAWMTPSDALRRRDLLEIELAPPTWITLSQLSGLGSVEATLGTLADRSPTYFATRLAFVDDSVIALYDGDAGYDDSDPDRPGPRHRLWMTPSGWRYERDS